MTKCPKCGVELQVEFKTGVEMRDLVPKSDDEKQAKLNDIVAAFESELPEAASLLTFNVGPQNITVKPKGFIKDKSKFSSICNVLGRFDANYISAGAETRWEIPV